MKLKVIVLIVMCAFFSGVKSQENTTYFFMGHVFSIDEKGEEMFCWHIKINLKMLWLYV